MISLWAVITRVSERSAPAALAAFLLTLAVTSVLIEMAPRLGLMDRPRGRKTHAVATPAIGGLGIALGCIPVAALVFPLGRPFESLLIAGALLLCVGVLDDLYDLHWRVRLCAHAAAALILVWFGGVQVNEIGTAFGVGDYHQLGSLAAPFTVLATTGLINAFNMADGVDGLAGSIGLTALGMLAAAALYAGNFDLAAGLVPIMGGVAAFLVFNLRTPSRRRARTFLGNAGSELLGLTVAWACFRLTQTPAHPVTPVLAPFLVAVPVIDCLVLMIHRTRKGRSPFAADRDHLHHILMDAGFSSTGVIAAVMGAGLAIGLAAALALLRHVPQPLFIVAFLLLMTCYFCMTMQRTRAVALFAALPLLAERLRRIVAASPKGLGSPAALIEPPEPLTE